MANSNNENIQKIMQELRQEYIQSIPQKIDALQSLYVQKKWYELETEFHKMKGTGKTYGLGEISELGLVFEAISKKSALNDTLFELSILWLGTIFSSRNLGQEVHLSSLNEFLELKNKYVPKESITR